MVLPNVFHLVIFYLSLPADPLRTVSALAARVALNDQHYPAE